MEEKIVESSKDEKMSIQSGLDKPEQHENDDVEKRWKQIDKFSKKEKVAFEFRLSFIYVIITKTYEVDDNTSDELNDYTLGIFQELVDNLGSEVQDVKADWRQTNVNKSQVMLKIIQNINQGLYKRGHITEEEYKGAVVKEGSLSEDYKQAVSIRAKKLIINSPSFKLAVSKYMSLDEILSKDGLFYFLDGDKFKALEFGNILLERRDVQENFENAQKAINFYYKKLPELLKSQLINDKTSEYEKSSIEENSTPKLSFAWNLLKKYDENIKSGKIKDENGNGFKELQKCVADCTKDIFYEYKGISQHMKNISKLINMYETKDTTDFNSLNSQDLTESINFMMDFFIKKKLSKIWYWVCVCNKI